MNTGAAWTDGSGCDRPGILVGSAAVISSMARVGAGYATTRAGDRSARRDAQIRGRGAYYVDSPAPNLTMLERSWRQRCRSNGADGKVVVDTFVQPAWNNLKAALDKLGNQRITHVIDQHWHFDHADNNAPFRKLGAAIVAHDNTKKRLSESHDLLGAKFPPSPAEALPTLTFSVTRRIDANGDLLMLGKIPNAHTDTDIYIKFQKANVLHLGDVFFNGMYPFIDASTGGSIGGMIEGTNFSMKQADASTKIVPGHGPLGDLKSLTTYRDMLVTVRDRVAKLKKSGQSLKEVLSAQPTKDLDPTWGKGFMQPSDLCWP